MKKKSPLPFSKMADLVLATVLAMTVACREYRQRQKEANRRSRRRLWVKKIHQNRTREMMEQTLSQLLDEPSAEFNNFCRMSFTDFEILLAKIIPCISRRDTFFRDAIPPKYRLAITLRFLASGDSYSSLHYLFKVSVPAISKIVKEVCLALTEVLKDEIKMPSTAEGWMNIERGFRQKFPHCIGSLDGKHIAIKCPSHSGTEYFNYKKYFSIVLLALVDSNYKFIFAEVGSQGRISDGGVFRNSLLWRKISRNELNLPAPCPLPGSENCVPYVFVGDGAFALSHNVMKPYPGEHEGGSPKRRFNQCLSSARVVVENTFGIISSTFQVFRRPIALDPDTAKTITMTCLLLHNFLRRSETSTSRYSPPGSFNSINHNGNIIWQCNPGSSRNSGEVFALNSSHTSQLNAVLIREEFSSYFQRISHETQ